MMVDPNTTSLSQLATVLGVSVDSLERLGITRNGRYWIVPERDSEGNVIGHATRSDTGTKGCKRGSRRGLTMVSHLGSYAGSSLDKPVLVVEGMSDTAAALDLGYDAVGRPSASGGIEHLCSLLKGRHAVVIGENDEAGRRGATKIAGALLDVAESVRMVYPPDGVKDLRAWKAVMVEGELAAAIRGVSPHSRTLPLTRTPVLIRMDEVQPESIIWLWQGRIPLGKLTLIVGDPGLGKSTLTLDMAARVSTGKGWPDQPDENCEPAGVVLLSAEDGLANTIRPRLDAAGADVTRITAMSAVDCCDPDTGATVRTGFTLADLPALEAAITQTPGCKLVIVDPLSAFLGTNIDSHNNTEIRAVLAPLADLAARSGVAIVAVTHLRKSEGQALYRAMGSLAFVAAARAAWLIAQDKDDPAEQRRLMLPMKNNLAVNKGGLAFQLQNTRIHSLPDVDLPQVVWETQPVMIRADDALAPPRKKRGPNADERNRAECWLRDALADGPRLARELIEESRECEGISKRTLDRARRGIGVVASRPKNPGPWWWKLSNGTGSDDKHGSNAEELGNVAMYPEKPEKSTDTEMQNATLPHCQDAGENVSFGDRASKAEQERTETARLVSRWLRSDTPNQEENAA